MPPIVRNSKPEIILINHQYKKSRNQQKGLVERTTTMDNSRLPYDDTLFLWFSCWSGPPQSTSSEVFEEGVDEEGVFEWLTEHVFCDDGSSFFNSESIHLMDPLLFENVCHNFPLGREIDFWSDSIIWNMPEAEVDSATLRGVGYDSFNYTIWNVSFPTYRLGDMDTQRNLQRSLELKLQNNYIAQDSLDGCRVAVVGKEAEFWLSNRISQEEKDVVLSVGIIFLVVQTLALIVVPFVGRKLALRESRRKELGLAATSSEEEVFSSERHSIDEMIRTSKGYIDFDVSQSKDIEQNVGDVERSHH
ncbi:unnamed protein product [Cylindrotheca closterium]|uniref:Uncharacterized protein n=1 Tax=Cylindrotheca closterium TaxID=2856 RepID=A0AAD2FVI3_9STRA|nr:unnamed protein product [Cylindrotheca closterium]